MSDDDRDIDVESDEGEEYGTRQTNVQRQTSGNHYYSQAEKRAHHNALERKRRDHIKDSFNSLRDTVPVLDGEKASRAQILKRAAEYIMLMRTKTSKRQRSIDKLKYQNNLLEAQINQLENNRAAGSFDIEEDDRELSYNESDDSDDDSEDDTSDEEMPVQKRPKKVKTSQH